MSRPDICPAPQRALKERLIMRWHLLIEFMAMSSSGSPSRSWTPRRNWMSGVDGGAIVEARSIASKTIAPILVFSGSRQRRPTFAKGREPYPNGQ